MNDSPTTMSQCSVFNCATLSSRVLLCTGVNTVVAVRETKDNSHLCSEPTVYISERIHFNSMRLALSHSILIFVGIRIQHKRSNSDQTCVAHKHIDKVFWVILSTFDLHVMHVTIKTCQLLMRMVPLIPCMHQITCFGGSLEYRQI